VAPTAIHALMEDHIELLVDEIGTGLFLD
jgi:hypothetical protein